MAFFRVPVSRSRLACLASLSIVLTLLLTCTSVAMGQAPPEAWSKAFNSATNDKGYAVTTDANGNVYNTGFFTGTMAVGTSNLTCPSFSTTGCVFLAKFAPDGTPQWATSFNNDYGVGSALATDSSGNVFVAGTFTDADFGCGAGVQSGSIFVAKLAPNGSCIWAKPFVSVPTAGTNYSGGQDSLNGIAIDTGGNVVITGRFGCSTNLGCAINFGGGLIASNQQPSYGGIFLAKLSGANGNWIWSDAYGGVSGMDYGTGVALDSSNNAFITGYFSSSVLNLGGSNLTKLGSTSFFVAKYNGSTGAPVWSELLGGANVSYAMGIAVDSGQNVVITGQFQGTVNFGSVSLTSANASTPEVFLARYANSNGLNLWAKGFGNSQFSNGNAIASDANGHVAITGYYGSTLDFGNGQPITSNGGFDIFLAEYNVADGSTVWAQGFGGIYNDSGLGIAIDSGGNTLLTGNFEGSANFGGGPIGIAGSFYAEVVVAKYGSGVGGGNPVPSITSSLTAAGTVNTAFNYQIIATNTPTSYNATGLPSGLTANTSTGLLSGTPTASGTFSVTLSATNSAGVGSATLNLTVNPAKPAINSSLTATGTANSAFSYQITATNNPTSFSATGLPSGLAVNTSTGLISGTPTVSGPFNVTISATNSGGTGSATLSLTINPAGSVPAITSATTASGTMNAAWSYQITASNSPTSFGATGLPSGLAVNTTSGLISGTPTVTGTFGVSLSATNSTGTGTATLSLAINGAKPAITSSLTASGTLNAAFSYQITATNSPTSYNATGLPSGLSVNTATGLISGTPTASGGFNVSLSATNAAGTGTATLSLTINSNSGVPVITSPLTASGSITSVLSYQISATNGPTSYAASNLPGGLSIHTDTGLIIGTPQTSGTYLVGLSATNASGTGTATLTLTISATGAAPAITSATTASGAVNTPFSYQIGATNSPTSYGASGLPSGLSVNTSTGLISGTPTASGPFTVSLSATNSSGTGRATLNLTINATVSAPVITSAGTASGTINAAFSYQITASNTPTSYGANGLPTGLSFNSSTGLISGTPTVSGTFNVGLSATNSSGTGTATLSLSIKAAALPDFSITASPSSQTVKAGQAASYTVTVNGTSGFSGTVGFAMTSSPAGATDGFAPQTVTGSGSTTMSVTPSVRGTYTLTITATSSTGIVHTTNVVLKAH